MGQKRGELKMPSTVIERLHLKFCKYILSLNKCTYTNMVYSEMGEIALSLHVKCRIIKQY